MLSDLMVLAMRLKEEFDFEPACSEASLFLTPIKVQKCVECAGPLCLVWDVSVLSLLCGTVRHSTLSIRPLSNSKFMVR